MRGPRATPGMTVFVSVCLLASCSSTSEPIASDQKGGPRAPSLQAALARSPEWLDYHDPDLSFSGYTLALYQSRIPFLMDMNGRAVHIWPRVRVSGRAKLLPTGHLAVISDAGRLEEYDWHGSRIWSFSPSGPFDMLHHDFTRLRNGHYLLPVLNRTRRADYLVEVDREGKQVWRWNSYDAIPEDLAHGPKGDRTHTNSVQELPANRWFDQGHEAFRPGNILLSVRNLNTLYIVARPGGEVVWRYREGLDWQHEARMIPPGYPRAGNILVFNNGYHHREQRRESSILELNPLDHTVAWSYRSPGLFSGTGGRQQALPNGNVLVTSSGGGRIFELTRQGRIVWQWAPPFATMRATRYPRDFCPQLEALEPPEETAVRRRDPESHLDSDLYSFALSHGVRRVKEGDQVTRVLRRSNSCEQLRLPDNPQLEVSYGIIRRGRCAVPDGRQVRFGVSVRPSGAEASEDLLVRTVAVKDFESIETYGAVSLRRETLSLASFERQSVEMCLSMASFAAGPPPDCFVWGPPQIQTSERSVAPALEEEQSPEVLEHQRQQLEALGYVN